MKYKTVPFLWIIAIGLFVVYGNNTGQKFEVAGIITILLFLLSLLGLRFITVYEYGSIKEVSSAVLSGICGGLICALNFLIYYIIKATS